MIVSLKCGFQFEDVAITRILESTTSSIQWRIVDKGLMHGMESFRQFIFWPQAVDGVALPSEGIAFLRQTDDHLAGESWYCVVSLANAVLPGKTTFVQSDFRNLISTKDRDEADSVLLVEIKRFFRINLPDPVQ